MEIVGRLIGAAIVAVIGILMNFIFMPAWSLASAGFWVFILSLLIIAMIVFGIVEMMLDSNHTVTVLLGVLSGISLMILIVGGLTSWTLFRASDYHEIIEIEDGNFEDDIPMMTENSMWNIVDVGTARKVGDRTIGGIKNASWYEVSEEYNLIKYNGEYYRISELLYGGLLKYNKAKSFGIPGYVLVNVETQEAKYVELEEPILYSTSGHFGKLLSRHLRKQYPSYMFGKSFFEIDEEGKPYYVTGVYEPTIGLFGGKKQEKFVVTNAVTGKSKVYYTEDLPEWIEHAYSVSYLMDQVHLNQTYINGFWNSIGSKTGVNCTAYDYRSDDFVGYNTAITATGEVVFYAGVTPASNAESNLGFILASPRTGKVKYYSCTGAEESSAQLAAEGLVSNLRYTATFPTIVNVGGEETYFMLLKDSAGLVQRYALCSVRNYTKVVQATSISQVLDLYKNEVKLEIDDTAETLSKEGVITNIYQAEIEGYTYFYFKLAGSDVLYMSSIENSNKQVLLEVGTKVKVEYVNSIEEGVCIVKKITF